MSIKIVSTRPVFGEADENSLKKKSIVLTFLLFAEKIRGSGVLVIVIISASQDVEPNSCSSVRFLEIFRIQLFNTSNPMNFQ